jgi:hypothetical protein
MPHDLSRHAPSSKQENLRYSNAYWTMEDFRVIRSQSELEGTGYLELLPGPYKDVCWNEASLFFEEDVFNYLEPIILLHASVYDHYAFTEIATSQ